MGDTCSKLINCITLDQSTTEIRKEVIIIITDDKRHMHTIKENLNRYTNYTKRVFIYPEHSENDSEFNYIEPDQKHKNDQKEKENSDREEEKEKENSDQKEKEENNEQEKQEIINDHKKEEILIDQKQEIINDHGKEEIINKQEINKQPENKKEITNDDQEDIIKDEEYENIVQMIQSPIGEEKELP